MLRWVLHISTVLSLLLLILIITFWIRSLQYVDTFHVSYETSDKTVWRNLNSGKGWINVEYLFDDQGNESLDDDEREFWHTEPIDDAFYADDAWRKALRRSAASQFQWIGVERYLLRQGWSVTFIHFGWLAAVFSLFPVLWLIFIGRPTWRRFRRRRLGRCIQCGYDLRASTAGCPECGHDSEVSRTKKA